MKEIKISNWKENETDVSTLTLISVVMNSALQKEQLTGFDNLRIINRIGKAMDEVKDNKIIFDDSDFEKITKWFEKYTPAQWGGNKNVFSALEPFMG